MKKSGFKIFMTVIAVLVLVIVLVCGTLVFLALQKPSITLKPAGSDPSAVLSSVQLDSKGISLSAADLAAVAGAAMNAALAESAEPPVFREVLAGGDLYKGDLRLALASTWILPPAFPLFAGKPLPVSLTMIFGVKGGEKPLVRIKGASIGGLPIPEALIREAFANGMKQAELPPFVAWTGADFELDLSQMKAGKLTLVSLETDGDGLRLGVDIPEQAVAEAYAAVGASLRKNGAAIHRDALSTYPAAPMARTVGRIAPSLAGEAAAVGSVEFLEGTASLKYAADGHTFTPQMGDTLFPGAVLATGADSSMELRLSDRSLVRLGENTTFDLARVDATGQGKTALELLGGSVRVKVAKLGGREEYRIKGPTVTLGVRGTEFLFYLNEDKSAGVAVVEGTVELASANDMQTVETGKEAEAGPDGTLGKPGSISRKIAKEIEDTAFETPFAVLEEPFSPDRLATLWSVVRPALSWWNGLPPAEQARLEKEYGGSIDVEGIGRSLGIDSTGGLSY